MRGFVCVRAMAAGCVAGAIGLLVAAGSARAEATVYEGWSYDAGDQFDLSPGTGNGWATDSGYFGPLAVVSPGLTHPAVSATGNALGTTQGTDNILISRPLASALDPTQSMWMSFLARRDDSTGVFLVSLQQLSGNRSFAASFGVDVDAGEKKYKARWENVGFAVASGDTFSSKPLSALGTTDLFLVRINAADPDANSQTFDMWVNPDLSALGAPDASVAWPSAFRAWSQIRYNVTGATVDELRIDSSMANVVNVPAPGMGAAAAVGICMLGRRRRP